MSDGPWDFPGAPWSTPLTEEDKQGLIPSYIATRCELNEAEQRNILRAARSRRWRRLAAVQLLDDLVARQLHRAMFDQVWTWAGQYRSRELNIGVDPRKVSVAVRDLMEDAKLWLGGDRPMPADEAAYRFHHRLVLIHPFPNGNGRHSRMMTDLLLRSAGEPAFTWGRYSQAVASTARDTYIGALQSADRGDYGPLAGFVRT
jgi:Fic-DOC domain mobile mystery protein B